MLPLPAHEPFRPLYNWYSYSYYYHMLFSTKALNFLAMYETLTQPKPTFASRLRLKSRRHHDRCIPRVSLHEYSAPAFKRLLDSGNDELFEPIYDSHYDNLTTGFIELEAITSTGKRKGRR
jgi:hypothetical protein